MSSISRVFGLSGSGMDIDKMVSDLMKVQRLKQDRIKQNKTRTDWQRSDYRDMNNALRALRDNVFTMKLQGTYQVKKAASSNENIVKVSATGAAVAGANTIRVTALASNARLNSVSDVAFTAGGANLNSQLDLTAPGTVVFKVNGSEDISIDTGTDTIDSFVSKINASKMADGTGAGVTAFYDKGLNRMFISSSATGADAKVDFDLVSGSDELFTKLNLGADPFAAVTGANAAFELNGMTLSKGSNQFTIAGVNYILNGVQGVTDNPVNISVSRDTDAVFNSIKSFVDLYNTTLDKVNNKISEERYRDYSPLTDDQRSNLTEDRQKKWEEKAKSGLLRSDTLLSGTIGKMRNVSFSTVSGVDSKYNSLSAIGITTGDYSEKGKLYIDESKLKDAIAANPEAIMDLFTRKSDVSAEKGLGARLYDNLTSGINQIINKAGSENSYSTVDNSILGKKIADDDKKISKWDAKLQNMEDNYYKQYTVLETAINKLNQQSSWLTLQLGGTSQ
jgi:flagellar hook-associated protein 2